MILYGHQLKKQSIKWQVNNMLKMLIAKAIKKHGLKAILLKVGDIAVKTTKTKKDDEVWAKFKKVLKVL